MDGESKLVMRATAGDKRALADLYDRYARPVFLTLVGILRTREDAEDAFQTAFISAWRKLPTLRRPERFGPWLFRIARNKARDVARRRLERSAAELRGEDLVYSDDGAAADEELESLVAGLAPLTRTIVLLVVVQGFSFEEAAAAVGKSSATVRRRYARALSHLREQLEVRDERPVHRGG